MELGKIIKEAREKRKLTQQRLAHLAGVATATISRIENGHSEKPSTLEDIAKVLGISVAEYLPPGSPNEVYVRMDRRTFDCIRYLMTSGVCDEVTLEKLAVDGQTVAESKGEAPKHGTPAPPEQQPPSPPKRGGSSTVADQ